MSLSRENKRISLLIRRFCTDHVLERKRLNDGRIYNEYRKSWLETIGNPRSGEVISKLTTTRICDEVKRYYPEASGERTIPGTNLAFDLYYHPTHTAFEICLGAITKEFHKDVLKAMLDQETHFLIVMYREYRFGTRNWILGNRWFDQPAQKKLIELTAVHKLKVIPIPLVLSR